MRSPRTNPNTRAGLVGSASVADGTDGNAGTFTQEQVEALVAERLEQETAGLKKNQSEALKEAKAAKARLAAYEGVDPEEFKRLKAAAEEAEQKKAAAEGDFSKLREQLIEKHNSELSAKDKRMQKIEAALNRRLTTDELRKALTGKAQPEYMELLVEHGSKYVQPRETDDDFEYVVTDGKGNALVADGKGSPMTIDLFVEQTLKSKFPGAFLGTGSSGGGATRSNAGGGGSVRQISKDDLTKGDNLQKVARGELKVAGY